LFPNLNYLSIYNCPDLESLCAHERPLNDLTSLHSLSISRCPNLVSFPKGGLPAPVLTRLKLKDCWNLKQLPESMHFPPPIPWPFGNKWLFRIWVVSRRGFSLQITITSYFRLQQTNCRPHAMGLGNAPFSFTLWYWLGRKCWILPWRDAAALKSYIS